MATVSQVAKASLQKILVQASEADLEPDEYQDFIFAMNNWMASLQSQSIDIGYTPVSNLSDEITVPDGAVLGIISNMAIQVSPDYGGDISPALIGQAQEGMKTIRRLGQLSSQTKRPSTLPIGSGNDDNSTGLTSKYYDNLP